MFPYSHWIKNLEPAANKIYEILDSEGGYLTLHDKSSPEEIREELQMSKKTFKKGIGTFIKTVKLKSEVMDIYG